MEKGVEAGKKLPKKFPSLAESFGSNHIGDLAFFNKLNSDFCFEKIQFSFFAKLNNSSFQNKKSANTVPLLFAI